MSRSFIILALAAALAAACGEAGKKTSKPCVEDEQCTGGVCFEERCFTACASQDECAPDEFCVKKSDASGEESRFCATASDFKGCAGPEDCPLVPGVCQVADCNLETQECGLKAAQDGGQCQLAAGQAGVCQAGECACAADCAGRECGDNGCGGSCGECDAGHCDAEGQCVSPCLKESDSDATCDGIDDDCDGSTDEDFVSAATQCGVGACTASGTTQCADGLLSDTCQPGTAAALDPTCDGSDDDCDGSADEDYQGTATTCGTGACAATGVTVCQGGQVKDTCHALSPESQFDFACDGLDEDCDGDTDEDYLPQEYACGPGACVVTGTSACEDGAEVFICPQVEVGPEVCNGQDDDCDGATDAADPDLTVNEQPACELTQGVCAGLLKPASLCADGAWQPCSLELYVALSDDTYQAVMESTCDGLDNDCDGAADEDFSVTGPDGTEYHGVGTACGVGACAGGFTVCAVATVRGALTCSSFGEAGQEECNGLDPSTGLGVDDDCNGVADAEDEGLLLPPCENQQGECQGAVKLPYLCVGGAWQECDDTAYYSNSPQYEPGVEVSCDGLDNDCNGEGNHQADEDFQLSMPDGSVITGVGLFCGKGACAGGYTECNPEGSGTLCPTAVQAKPEACNGMDDDCDGQADEASDQPCGPDLVCAEAKCHDCWDGNDVVWDGCDAGTIVEFQVNTTWEYAEHQPAAARLDGDGFVVAWEGQADDGTGTGQTATVIRAQRFGPEGKPLGAELVVDSLVDPRFSSYSPAVTGVSGGGFQVAWLRYDPELMGNDLRVRVFKPTGEPATGDIVEVQPNYPSPPPVNPRLGSAFGTHVVLAWQNSDPSYGVENVYSQLLTEEGYSKTGAAPVMNPTQSARAFPDLSVNPDGSYVVTWTDAWYYGQPSVAYRRMDNLANPLGMDVQVPSDDTSINWLGSPAVTGFPDGSLVLAWTYTDMQYASHLVGQRFGADDKPQGVNFAIESSGSYPENPGLAALPDGRFVVAWSGGQDQSGSAAMTRFYKADGTPDSDPIQLNAFTNSDQRDVSVVVFPDGRLLFTWESCQWERPAAETQDGAECGVYAQRLDAEGRKVYR
jgi:hypothetical protein